MKLLKVYTKTHNVSSVSECHLDKISPFLNFARRGQVFGSSALEPLISLIYNIDRAVIKIFYLLIFNLFLISRGRIEKKKKPCRN